MNDDDTQDLIANTIDQYTNLVNEWQDTDSDELADNIMFVLKRAGVLK